MLIMSQNRKCLFNTEKAGTLFLSSCYGNYEEGKPVKILASFPPHRGCHREPGRV